MAGAFPNLVSPGVAVREVDLTAGRIQTANPWTAGIVGPFVRGPVEYPTQVADENDLVNIFGVPTTVDSQNTYWYSASGYLSYGGQCRIVRCDGENLRNANSGYVSTVDLRQEDVGVTTTITATTNSYLQVTGSSLNNSISQNTISVDSTVGMATGQSIYHPLIGNNAVITGISTNGGVIYNNAYSATLSPEVALNPGDTTNVLYLSESDAAELSTGLVLNSPYIFGATPTITAINNVGHSTAGFTSSITLSTPIGINTNPTGLDALVKQSQILDTVGFNSTTNYTSGIATGTYTSQRLVGDISGKIALADVVVASGSTTGQITLTEINVILGSSENGFLYYENINLEFLSSGVVIETIDSVGTASTTTKFTSGSLENPSVGVEITISGISTGGLITFSPAGVQSYIEDNAGVDRAVGAGYSAVFETYTYNQATLSPQTQILAGVNTTGLIIGDYVVGNYILANSQILSVDNNQVVINKRTTNRVATTTRLSFYRINPIVNAGGNKNEAFNQNAPGYIIPGIGITDLKILNDQQFRDDVEAYYSQDNFTFASRNPGSWANGMTVCMIDYAADQIISLTGLTTDKNLVGCAVTQYINGQTPTPTGFTTTTSGTLRGVITGINTTSLLENGQYNAEVNVKVCDFKDRLTGITTNVNYNSFGFFKFRSTTGVSAGSSIGIGNSTDAPYTEASNGICRTVISPQDWWNNQKLNVPNLVAYWKDIVLKPSTSQYAASRNCRNDGLAVVVVDSTGLVTQIKDNIAERFENVSKAHKGENDNPNWFKDVILSSSQYIFAGHNDINTVASGFQNFASNETITQGEGSWDSYPENTTYNVIGNVAYTLIGGENYSLSAGDVGQSITTPGFNGFLPTLADLITAFSLFRSVDELNPYELNFICAGPSYGTKVDTQTIGSYIISLANNRKDLVACISPYAPDVIRPSSRELILSNILDFFSAIPSSSYAILDSGIKYTFDRFNNSYIWVPCNPDVAGIIARTAVNNYPWYSPAGVNRGVLNNAIKIGFNPDQEQRDELYADRINPIRFMPGYGVVLFGDKTALGYPSAFDRINVRQLFLYIEKAIRTFSNSVLFNFNDEITRANFVNQVQPFLREIQTQRGIYDFRVICDSTNNPPEVIDRNELKADFYIKPARSINFIGLTFVAVRTGDSFETIIGTV